MKKHQFAKYDSYKAAELQWLDNMPEHWTLDRVKNLTITQSGTTPPSEASEYYDEGLHYWVRTTDLNNNHLSKSEHKITNLALEHFGLKFIPVNSVLLAMYGGMGTIGKNSILDTPVTINQSVCAIYPNNKKFHATYLWYYVQYFRPTWEIFANSARKDPNINQEAIKRLWVTLPPLEEQQAIADYLDGKSAQIDRKIELLEAKAEKYADLKQSLINETVTRGLEKTVPMKDSGVEWIGEIPSHWEVKRAKDLFKKMSRNALETDGIITAFRDGEVTLRENRRTSGFTNAIYEHGYQGIRAGDLVIHAMDGFAGAIGVSDSNGKSSPVYQAYIPTNAKRVHNPYYGLLVREMALSGFVSSLGKGIRERSSEFRHKEFAPLKLPVPPFEEQKAIAAYLESKTAQIEKIVETIYLEVERLKELRKTLINDVVTGKIRVYEDKVSAG